MQKIESVLIERLQTNGQQKTSRSQKEKPIFNQDGNQQIINFEEIKNKVNELVKTQATTTDNKPIERQLKASLCSSGASHSRVSSLFSPIQEETKSSGSLKSRQSLASQYDELGSFDSHRQSDGPSAIEIQNLLESFDLFFVSSLNFNIQSLAELICALAQLTVGSLGHLRYSGQNTFRGGLYPQKGTSTDKTSGSVYMTQTDSEILAQINTFAMSRLVETALVNVSRIESIWKILIAHFDILSNC